MRCQKLRHRYTMLVTARRAAPYELVRHVRPFQIIAPQPRWRPDVDLIETAEEVRVIVDLAGVEEDDLEIAVFQDAVVIEGERRVPCEAGGVYHAAAIRQGPFHIDVPLPTVIDPARAVADYQAGLLRVVLPKTDGE
jgi:HSP20 family protein